MHSFEAFYEVINHRFTQIFTRSSYMVNIFYAKEPMEIYLHKLVAFLHFS